jgi:hypothetical protein
MRTHRIDSTTTLEHGIYKFVRNRRAFRLVVANFCLPLMCYHSTSADRLMSSFQVTNWISVNCAYINRSIYLNIRKSNLSMFYHLDREQFALFCSHFSVCQQQVSGTKLNWRQEGF